MQPDVRPSASVALESRCWVQHFALPSGLVIELTLIWTTARRWSRERLPNFAAFPVGPYVIAVRLIG